MRPEHTYLAGVTALTAVMWIPYIVDRVKVGGLAAGIGYPTTPPPQSPWAQRLKAAHYNAVENLVVFAALVLIATEANIRTNATVWACMIYFWARLVHVLAYTFAVPYLRTISFSVGFLCQMTLAWALLVR